MEWPNLAEYAVFAMILASQAVDLGVDTAQDDEEEAQDDYGLASSFDLTDPETDTQTQEGSIEWFAIGAGAPQSETNPPDAPQSEAEAQALWGDIEQG